MHLSYYSSSCQHLFRNFLLITSWWQNEDKNDKWSGVCCSNVRRLQKIKLHNLPAPSASAAFSSDIKALTPPGRLLLKLRLSGLVSADRKRSRPPLNMTTTSIIIQPQTFKLMTNCNPTCHTHWSVTVPTPCHAPIRDQSLCRLLPQPAKQGQTGLCPATDDSKQKRSKTKEKLKKKEMRKWKKIQVQIILKNEIKHSEENKEVDSQKEKEQRKLIWSV